MTSLIGEYLYSRPNVFDNSPLVQGDSNVFVKNEQEDVTLGNLTLTGDLIVQGTSTTVSDLSVSDPLIELAVGNTVSDNLNIGFFGDYNNNGVKYTGIIRKKDTKDWHLFKDSSKPGDTTTFTPSAYANLNLQNLEANGSINVLGVSQFQDRVIFNGSEIQTNRIRTGDIIYEDNEVRLGANAGSTNQGTNAIAIGSLAGQTAQLDNSIAIGVSAGQLNQGSGTIAVGVNAGNQNQSQSAIAIGLGSGRYTQGRSAIAIGLGSGATSQATNAIAIGVGAGQVTQGYGSIAIGSSAGQSSQGINSIAIGNFAGRTNQHSNSIILNASGSNFNSTSDNALYITPIRNLTSQPYTLQYDNTTGEVSYGVGGSSGTFDPSQILMITNTTQSTSKDTGALVIDGGLGIEKNVNIGGNLKVVGLANGVQNNILYYDNNTGDITYNEFNLANPWNDTTSYNYSWTAVAYGGNKFVAISNNNNPRYSMNSADGITWNLRTVPIDSNFKDIIYGNNLFVAISSGTSVITSIDGGLLWNLYICPNSSWNSIAYGNSLFVAVSTTASSINIMTSPNGSTWTTRTNPLSQGFNCVTFGEGKFVALQNGDNVLYSSDGITWSTASISSGNWTSICYGKGIFVAVNNSISGYRIATSDDGISWTLRSTPIDQDYTKIIFGGSKFVAISKSGVGNRSITSLDGIYWTIRATIGDYDWTGLAYGNGTYVAVHNSLNTTSMYSTTIDIIDESSTPFDPTQPVIITNTTQALSITTGALQVAGGISTQGNIYAGGGANVGTLLRIVSGGVYTNLSSLNLYSGTSDTLRASIGANANFSGDLIANNFFTKVNNNVVIGTLIPNVQNIDPYNCIIGNDIAQNGTTIRGNTLVGSSNSTALTTGDYNTIIGSASGKSITTGGYNTIIGSTISETNLTTGNDNTLIGSLINMTGNYSAVIAIGRAIAPTQSNSFYVSDIRGTGSSTPALVYNTTTKEITYNTSSRKYKQNIINNTIDTSVLHQLRIVQFDRKDDGKNYIGLIAEEADEVCNYFTWKNEQNEPEGIDWQNVQIFMLNEMMKLKNENDALKKELQMNKQQDAITMYELNTLKGELLTLKQFLKL